MLRDIPETTALIDHLAEPHMGTAVEFVAILELGMTKTESSNMYVKLLGLNISLDTRRST